MAKDSFWDFDPWVKYDEIVEGTHDHLYYGALRDSKTGVDKLDTKTFILYGDQEALLFRPVNFICRIGVELLGAFLNLKHG
jgi:hypothetical protein